MQELEEKGMEGVPREARAEKGRKGSKTVWERKKGSMFVCDRGRSQETEFPLLVSGDICFTVHDVSFRGSPFVCHHLVTASRICGSFRLVLVRAVPASNLTRFVYLVLLRERGTVPYAGRCFIP